MKKTATKLKTISIILIFGLISSCEWITSEDEKIPELITISYLDLSTSQDSASIKSMTEKLLQVIENQPKDMNTTFIVRAIHKDSGIEPIIKLTSTAVEEASFVDKRTHSNKRQTDQELVKDAIANYLKMENPSGRDETCICNSLENSIQDLVLIDSTVNIRLIVFSDLFEECGKGSSLISGGLFMCRTNMGIKSKISKLMEIIESDYTPTVALSNYVQPENLYFILTQSDDYNESSGINSKCLNNREKLEAWKAILIKLGYSENDFNHQNGIAFSTSLPDRLIKNN